MSEQAFSPNRSNKLPQAHIGMWGRAAVAAFTIGALGGAGVVDLNPSYGAHSVPTEHPKPAQHNHEHSATDTFIVPPNGTLWDIARAEQPEGDPRGLMDQLVKAHGGDPNVQPGEKIQVPHQKQ